MKAQENKTVYRLVEPNPSKSRPTLFAREDPLEGKTIGDNNRYLLQTLLVQGGLSQVYQALDTKFEDRIVAIKLMTNYSAASGQHVIKRFMREVKAISRLKHPNIIQILDFGVTPDEAPFYGSPFYVMEYFVGKTLQNLLTENKILPLASLLSIIHQVCAGLKQAAREGIVHRDLKPDNIFLVAGGSVGEIVKIIDFGIAKNINYNDKNYTQLNQVESFIGTYRYASPEQCQGLPNIDQRSYIYSLGVILYEAICGHNPYGLDDDLSPSQTDWIACHLRVPPKPLKEQIGCENIENGLENIVMKCIAKSPQDRFSDLGELQNAVANSLSVRTGGVNYPAQTDTEIQTGTKINNDLEENSRYFKTEAEVKQTTNKTVVEKIKTISNNFSKNFTFSSNKKKLSVELLAGIAAVFVGIVGTGGYLLCGYLFFNQPEKTSQNQPEKIFQNQPEKIFQNQPEKISQNQPEKTSQNQPEKIFQSQFASSAITPDRNNLSVLVETLETQYQQGNYQDCYQSGINSSNQDDIEIKEWIGKCGLEAAKIKGKAYSYSGAIAIAQTIPNTVSNYQEVQDSVDIWSGKILDYATKVYKEQGQLEEAVKITKNIPENSNLTATLPELISQWQQETEKHQALIDNAQNLLNQAQWYGAKQEVEKIPTDFDFWRQKAQPILNKANQQINAIAAEEQRRREQAAAEQRRREQAAAEVEQPPREQAEDPLRERLNNTPLLEDDSLRERLHNHGLFF